MVKYSKYYAVKGVDKNYKQKRWVLDMCSVVLGFSYSLLRWLSLIRIVDMSEYSALSDRQNWLRLNKGV